MADYTLTTARTVTTTIKGLISSSTRTASINDLELLANNSSEENYDLMDDSFPLLSSSPSSLSLPKLPINLLQKLNDSKNTANIQSSTVSKNLFDLFRSFSDAIFETDDFNDLNDNNDLLFLHYPHYHSSNSHNYRAPGQITTILNNNNNNHNHNNLNHNDHHHRSHNGSDSHSNKTSIMSNSINTNHYHHHTHHYHNNGLSTTTTSNIIPTTSTSTLKPILNKLFNLDEEEDDNFQPAAAMPTLQSQPPSPQPAPETIGSNVPDILIFDNSGNSSEMDELGRGISILSSIKPTANLTITDNPFKYPSPLPSSSTSTSTSSIVTAIMDPDDNLIDNNGSNNIFYFDSSCFSSPEEYELFTSMLCSSLLVLGIVYLTYGYRCFRALTFFLGLVFGALLFHTICIAENIEIFSTLLPYGHLLATLVAGLLVALFTMLVVYIGLFLVGIHLGLMSAIGILIVIYLLRPYYVALQGPLSGLTLLIFFVALSLVGALKTIYFSKACTIVASSMYGSAITLLCADYFVENFRMIHWFLDQLSQGNDWYGLLANIRRNQTLCIGSYIELALWPMFTAFGILVQCCCTAKHFKYGNGYGMVDGDGIGSIPPITIGHHANHAKAFSVRDNSRNYHHYHHSNIRSTNLDEAKLEQRHRKYRYLYQVRTAHGDVISQRYLQSLQNKKQLCLPDQDSYTFNSDLSSHFLPSESRTTTLSVA